MTCIRAALWLKDVDDIEPVLQSSTLHNKSAEDNNQRENNYRLDPAEHIKATAISVLLLERLEGVLNVFAVGNMSWCSIIQ